MRAKVDDRGRVSIPAAMRIDAGVTGGDVELTQVPGGILIAAPRLRCCSCGRTTGLVKMHSGPAALCRECLAEWPEHESASGSTEAPE